MSKKWDDIVKAVDAARLAADPAETLSNLRSARDSLDELINDTMADALVNDGVSIRSVASMAGFSENTVGPRLAQSSVLASYARDDGRITSAEVHRARYDAAHSGGEPKPLKFVPRTTSRKDSDD
ncbi:MAG: hypothetical protein E6R04_04465 [Spirochaetes bacterium]|nr:MAG: hypothetical protein E6R04_04465 [Spirochaetota bacterium]